MPKLNRAAILAAKSLVGSLTTVAVPEWDGEVTLRPMTGARRDRFEQACSKDLGNNIRARLAAYSICDEFGVFQFDENDIPALGELSAAGLDRIFGIAMELNGIGTKDVEKLEKN